MSEETGEALEAYFREQADRPLGDVERVSGRTLQPFSMASYEGAENLIAKAWRVWREDRPRGLAYLGRAAALPFDDFEGAFPAALAVGMHLFSLVSDEWADDPEEDGPWLEAAVTVLESTDTDARFDLRDALADIGTDYEDDLSPRGQRLLRAAVHAVPPRPALREQSDLAPSELRDRIAAILDVSAAYEDALDALADQGS